MHSVYYHLANLSFYCVLFVVEEFYVFAVSYNGNTRNKNFEEAAA